MDQYQEKVVPILDQACQMLKLDSINSNEQLTKLGDKINVKPSHMVLLLSIVLLTLSLLNVGASLICNIVGFLYPAYMSFKALETQTGDDDKQWLTYWVVYSLCTVLDTFIGFTLSFIPFYYFLKLAFYIYLFHPKTLGASLVYDRFIQPFLKKYESDIDSSINKIKSKAERKMNE